MKEIKIHKVTICPECYRPSEKMKKEENNGHDCDKIVC